MQTACRMTTNIFLQDNGNDGKDSGILERNDEGKNRIRNNKINLYNSHAIATRRRNYEDQQVEINKNPISSGNLHMRYICGNQNIHDT